MFLNSQDTTLLQGTLMSAANMYADMESSDSKPFHLRGKTCVVDIVSTTIKMFTQNTSKVKTEIEFLQRQLHLNRRFHSAIFFTALRSNGITCVEADKFYGSILYTFPTMDWKFYLKLNYECNWSEYFIECARQLQPDILAAVIKALLLLGEEGDLIYYTWHLAMQSIAWKFFELGDPSIIEPVQSCAFHFPFNGCQTTPEKREELEVIFSENPPKSKLLHAYVTIFNHMIAQFSKTGLEDFDFMKVVLHFYKTIFKLVLKSHTFNGEIMKVLFGMNELLKQCILGASESEISSVFDLSEIFVCKHYYATTSWEICESYLMFLVCNYWKDVEKIKWEDVNGSFNFPPTLLPDELYKKMLLGFCPLFQKHFGAEDHHSAKLLKNIICYDLPFASRAAGILLVHPEIRTTFEVVCILKEHVSKLSPIETYPLLADAIMETESSDVKNTFLNIFYQILSEASPSLYNDALKYIFDHYGVNDHFKLLDTDSRLIQFTRKTMLLDEAEKFLLPLFIQQPLNVLKTLIEQALIRGAEGIAIIPVLKYIPSVCYYKDGCLLLEELSYYFLKKELQTHEEKNIVSLVESVMMVQTEQEILSLDLFLELCILPSLTKKLRIDLTLECLNVSLNILFSNEDLKKSSYELYQLMEWLTFALEESIIYSDGKRKDLLLLVLYPLLECDGFFKNFIENSCIDFKKASFKVVSVYFKAVDIEKVCEATVAKNEGISETLWTYCCQCEDLELEFEQRLSCIKTTHEQLLSILIPLLSHFTKKEWIQSAYLLKEYFKYFSPKECFDNLSSLFPKSDPQSYAVIRTLLDCYCAVLHLYKCDTQYVTSCFTNTVINFLGQESHPQLLLNVFLDACYVTSVCKIDTLHLLSSFFISIKKMICLTCKDKLLQRNYLKLALTGVKCLPDSEAKSSLLQKFSS